MNKKEMYNRIMEHVSIEVKKALNESHELNEFQYYPSSSSYNPNTEYTWSENEIKRLIEKYGVSEKEVNNLKEQVKILNDEIQKLKEEIRLNNFDF